MISEGRVTNAGCSDNAVVRKETAKIGAVTLMFDNPETESEWNSDNLQRNITLTTRYLFFASLFQGCRHFCICFGMALLTFFLNIRHILLE